MALKDRFRIDELVSMGSGAINRDSSGNILVQKTNGKEIPRKKEVEKKPFGESVIKGKNETPILKADLNESYQKVEKEQSSFSGETSGYIEKPYYNEEELKKAVDVKVDELIKPKKEQRGEFVPKPTYDKLLSDYEASQAKVQDLTEQLNAANSTISSLQGEITSLTAQVDSLNTELVIKDEELAAFLDRYNKLLQDFQTSIIKGTKEGIERVSLTAQVRGLQAQKETLQAQLKAQENIVTTLQQQAEIQQQVAQQQQEAAKERLEEAKKANLLDIVGDRKFFEVKGTVGWAAASSNKSIKADFPMAYDDRKKDPKGVLSGAKFEFYNIGEEDVTLTVTNEIVRGVNWLNGVPSTITIPKSADGNTPGMTTITLSRNGNAGKGNHDSIIKFKNSKTGEELKLKTAYWQARSRRST